MADDKKVIISAKLDTTGFDSEVKRLQDKMKELQKSGAVANSLKGDPVFGGPANKVFEELKKGSASYFQGLYKEQEQAFKNADKIINQLKEQIKLEKEKANVNKEQIKNNEDLLRSEERAQKARIEHAAKIKSLMPSGVYEDMQRQNMSKDIVPNYARGWTYGRQDYNSYSGGQRQLGYSGGGGGGGGGGRNIRYIENEANGGEEEDRSSFTKMLKGIGATAVLKGAINATTKFVEHRINRDTEMLSSKASAATVAATGLQETIAGRGGSQVYWGQERQNAMNMSMERQNNISNLDTFKGWGKGAMGAIGGASLALLAAPFTGGASLGLAGGMLMAGGALTGVASDKRSYNRFFDSKAYSALSSKEAMQNYQSNLEAQKALDPSKAMGEDNYYANMGNYQLQARAMGMSSTDMLGKGNARIKGIGATNAEDYIADKNEGFLQKGLGRFSEETLNRNWQGMKGAGASSAMLREGRDTSATYERQFGLENAGALFGAQGAVGQGIGQSEQNLKKVLTDAVRGGVDLSKMPQELQKFTQTAIELATASGGFSQASSQQLSAAMVGPATSASIGAAKTSTEQFEEKSSSAEGAEGQMGMAYWMKKYPGLNANQYRMLNQTSQASFQSMPKSLQQGLAKQMNTTPEALEAATGEAGAYKQTMLGSSDVANTELEKFVRDNPKYASDPVKNEIFNSLQAKAYTERAGSVGKMGTPLQELSNIKLNGNANVGFSQSGIDSRVPELLARRGDENFNAFEAQRGIGQRTAINAQADNQKSLTAAASSFDSNQALFNSSFQHFSDALKTGGDGLSAFNESLKKVLGTLQSSMKLPANNSSTQATSKKGGG